MITLRVLKIKPDIKTQIFLCILYQIGQQSWRIAYSIATKAIIMRWITVSVLLFSSLASVSIKHNVWLSSLKSDEKKITTNINHEGDI